MTDFISKLAPLFKEFIKFRTACKCWNRHYELMLCSFDRYCMQHFPNHDSLTQSMVNGWCAQRSSESPQSTNSRNETIVALISYLRAHQLTEVDSPTRLAYKQHLRLPHPLTDDMLRRFFHECDRLYSDCSLIRGCVKKFALAAQLTCPVLFRFLYSTGMRPSATLKLKRTNVDLKTGVVEIQEDKVMNQYRIVLHDSTLKIMRAYDKQVELRLQSGREYFFYSAKGNHLSTPWLNSYFRRLWDKANPENHEVVPMDFRHNYATANINAWIGNYDALTNMTYLSKSMGHSCMQVTLDHYYDLSPQLARLIEKKCGAAFDVIVPEVQP